VADIDTLKAAFLNDYGRTAVARASITQLKVFQQPNQLVRDYVGQIQIKIDELELAVTPMAPNLPANIILQNMPQDVDLGAAGNLAWLQAQYRRIYQEGYNAFKQPLVRNLIIDGLLPSLRDEVLRANPADALDAINVAKQAEKDLELKSAISKNGHKIDELQIDAFDKRRRGPNPPSRGGFANRNRGRSTTSSGKEVPTCYYCNKRGHVQKDCFKRQRENGAYKQPPKGSVHEVEDATTEQPQTPPEEPPQEFYTNLNSIDNLNW
jgi:Zinc knuckle